MSPLAISVRQQNLEMTRLLLRYGAPPGMRTAGLPLLLHFHEAATAAAAMGPPSDRPLSLGRATSPTAAASGRDGGVTSSMDAGGAGDGGSSFGDDMASLMQVTRLGAGGRALLGLSWGVTRLVKAGF